MVMAMKKKVVRPSVSLKTFLSAQIEASDKSQKEIAEAIGYTKPNIITMFKQGLTKVPIVKIGPLAKALGIDPRNLLRIAMHDYMPETWTAIEEVMGPIISEHEYEIIKTIREVTSDADPRMSNSEQRSHLKAFAKTLA